MGGWLYGRKDREVRRLSQVSELPLILLYQGRRLFTRSRGDVGHGATWLVILSVRTCLCSLVDTIAAGRH